MTEEEEHRSSNRPAQPTSHSPSIGLHNEDNEINEDTKDNPDDSDSKTKRKKCFQRFKSWCKRKFCCNRVGVILHNEDNELNENNKDNKNEDNPDNSDSKTKRKRCKRNEDMDEDNMYEDEDNKYEDEEANEDNMDNMDNQDNQEANKDDRETPLIPDDSDSKTKRKNCFQRFKSWCKRNEDMDEDNMDEDQDNKYEDEDAHEDNMDNMDNQDNQEANKDDRETPLIPDDSDSKTKRKNCFQRFKSWCKRNEDMDEDNKYEDEEANEDNMDNQDNQEANKDDRETPLIPDDSDSKTKRKNCFQRFKSWFNRNFCCNRLLLWITVFQSPFYSTVPGHEDKMRVIIRSCVLLLWIHTLTVVKSQLDCTLEQFLKSNHYDTNFDTSSLEDSYPGGKQVRVGCNVGFSGFFKLICVEGRWQPRGTKCQARSCGHPGDAQFADFHLEKGDDFVFGSQVVYTCQKGYQMVSRSNARRCMAGGWDGVVPVCEAQQCPMIHVDGNVQVVGDPEEATYGNVVRFSCKSNTMVLNGPSEIYCDENGKWSAEAPNCEEIKCTIPEIQNGELTGQLRDYKEHEVLHFECNRKFKKQTERPSKCTKIGTKAEFSPAPECEPTRCKLPLTTLEGTRYDTSRNVFSPGDTVTTSCGNKYWISTPQSTSAVSTCNDDGEWDLTPVCQEVRCRNERPQSVYYWNVRWGQIITLDETVSYQCSRGYRATSDRARCTRDGWSPNPLCQVKTCNRHEVPNADIVTNDKQTYNYNQKVRYVCKDGYEGQFTLTCGDNRWTGNARCTEAGCKKHPINNAIITHNNRETYDHNEAVQYSCEHDRNRYFSVTCEKGKWTGIQSCQACGEAQIQNGFVVAQEDNKLYYTCNEGFKLPNKGWWGEAVCEGRKWSGLQECIAVSSPCKPPPQIENAVIVKPYQKQYLSDSEVTYQCRDKYTMEGEDRIRCLDGQWEIKNISCRETKCETPEIQNGELTGQLRDYKEHEVLHFECNRKFKKQTEIPSICTILGTKAEFSPAPECEPTRCKLPLTTPEGSRYDTSRNVFSPGDTVTTSCGDKYWISTPQSTSAVSTCNDDGEWDITPVCQEVRCSNEKHQSVYSWGVRSGQIITLDKTVSYQCKRGYTATSGRAQCTRDGWSPNPLCQGIVKFSLLNNMNINVESASEKVGKDTEVQNFRNTCH
ncbi:complement factor H-like [Tautogolabrus adspersus]